jgi:hypothetical protein
MKKFTKKDLQFRRLEDKILFKKTNEINGQSFVCRNLTRCKVFIPCHMSTIYIDDCIECEIYLGPTESSVFIRDCTKCKITLCAQQIRISDSSDLTVFLFSSTDLTLEKARNIQLGPYNFVYPGIKDHFKSVEMDTSQNQGFVVMDFDREYAETQEDLPLNYSLIRAKDFNGFYDFHDQMMLRYYPDDTTLKEKDESTLLRLIDEAKQDYPVPFPEVFGGKGGNPLSLNSEIKMKDDSDTSKTGSDKSMISFKMGLSPIIAQQKFMFDSNKLISSEHQIKSKAPQVTMSQNLNFHKKKEKEKEEIFKKKVPTPKKKIATPSSPSKSDEVDLKFIRSKLSANELKVVRYFSQEEGDDLLKQLYFRRLEQFNLNKQKIETEKNLKDEKLEKAKELMGRLREDYEKNIQINKENLSKKNKKQNESNCDSWENTLEILEQAKSKSKNRFLDAIKLKLSLIDS